MLMPGEKRPVLPPWRRGPAPPAIDLRQLRTDTPAAGEPSSKPDGNDSQIQAP